MAASSSVELNHAYLMDEEICLSDDSEVSVANMNRGNGEKVQLSSKVHDEKTRANSGEIVSDDEYNYSDDSVCSDDSFEKDSEITNVTPRSSLSAGSPLNRTMSLEFPNNRLNELTRRHDNAYPRKLSDNIHDNGRMCCSANDNRYTIRNVPHFESMNSRTQRRNMSFSNSEMRRIETENQYLLKKIMAQQKPQNKPLRMQSVQPRISSSAINRKKLQKRIEEENMMLLRRIQQAKSCAVPSNVIPGYRLTSL